MCFQIGSCEECECGIDDQSGMGTSNADYISCMDFCAEDSALNQEKCQVNQTQSQKRFDNEISLIPELL